MLPHCHDSIRHINSILQHRISCVKGRKWTLTSSQCRWNVWTLVKAEHMTSPLPSTCLIQMKSCWNIVESTRWTCERKNLLVKLIKYQLEHNFLIFIVDDIIIFRWLKIFNTHDTIFSRSLGCTQSFKLVQLENSI